MIELFTGTVGGGKSYHALCEGLEKVTNRGGFVVANFPIKAKTKKEKERWIFLEDFEPEDLIRLSFERGSFGKEGRALIIIDEATVWFNSRDWQIDGNKRKEWIKFFSQSRKFGYDVILIVQDKRMLDRQIRSLAEFEIKHVKLRNYKYMKWLPWQVFAYIQWWSGADFKGSVTMALFNPWKAKRYDTMKLFKLTDEMAELMSRHGYDPGKQTPQEAEGEGVAGVPSPHGALEDSVQPINVTPGEKI